MLSIESNVFRLATFSLVRNLERVAEKFFGVAEVVVRSVGLLLKPGDRLTGRAIALKRMQFLSSEIFLFRERERVALDIFFRPFIYRPKMGIVKIESLVRGQKYVGFLNGAGL